MINAADWHPLIVPRVRHYLTDVLRVSDEQRLAWIQHWLGAGLQAIEALLAEHPRSGQLCHSNRPTVADICLVTLVTPAKTFNCPLDSYPRVMRVYDNCMAIPAVADAHHRGSLMRNNGVLGGNLLADARERRHNLLPWRSTRGWPAGLPSPPARPSCCSCCVDAARG